MITASITLYSSNANWFWLNTPSLCPGVIEILPAVGVSSPLRIFHKSGFTTAIRANQAIAVAITEFSGNIFKQRLSAKLHGDVRGGDQRNCPGRLQIKK